MALVGGGGAGNVTGSNPAGTGSTLNYVGEFAYANSGVITTDGGNESTLLEFDTAGSVIVGRTQFSYLSINQSDDILFRIYFNGEIIAGVQYPHVNTGSHTNYFEIIIPPYTNVKITGDNVESSTNRDLTAMVIGRVYA